MSIQENLTQILAKRISRRNFLKSLGVAVLGLGAALIGKPVEEVQAAGCCPGPECSGCRIGGSNCPYGYRKVTSTTCCLQGCKWTCNVCEDLDPPHEQCICSHDDMVSCPYQNCAQKNNP
jgi:hypothetical protein